MRKSNRHRRNLRPPKLDSACDRSETLFRTGDLSRQPRDDLASQILIAISALNPNARGRSETSQVVLALNELGFERAPGTRASQATVNVDGKSIDAAFKNEDGYYVLRFPEQVTINNGRASDVRFVLRALGLIRIRIMKFMFMALAGMLAVPHFATADRPVRQAPAYNANVPEPTSLGIRYGKHERHILDFWKAPSDNPTPLVFVIHGGGWQGGSKERLHRFVDTAALLKEGISVVAINYRLMAHSQDVEPPVKAPLLDAARALQFVRCKADEWNIDKARIGAAGGSAGRLLEPLATLS